MSFDKAKFRALVHYVCHKCHDPSILGATKLNKVLWYSDVIAYMDSGGSITNESYVKQQFGPVPKHILLTIRDLESRGNIVVRDAEYFRKVKKEYVSLKRPDISKFSANEISLVDAVIDVVCRNHTASSISAASHDYIWHIADIGEELPYATAFVSEFGDIGADDMKWAKKEISKIIEMKAA
jgi:hypothetical protein